MTDFLEEKKREIQSRMKELRPLVEEFHRLEAAAAALEGVKGSAPAAAAPARRAGSRRAASGGGGDGGGSGRRGRPRGSGTRAKQALELVRSRPGISIPEMAEAMGIQQNYLYRVLPGLQKDGLVRKDGRGWHPLEAA
jgi:CRP-like cAMP-binding protein